MKNVARLEINGVNEMLRSVNANRSYFKLDIKIHERYYMSLAQVFSNAELFC